MTSGGPILIAGAGIAGLATALALARTGRRSIILERRSALSEAGAGIQIGPNGMRVLAALGVEHALEPLAGKPERIVIRTGADGRTLTQLPLGRTMRDRYGAPYWVAHRADLQKVLADAVARAGAGLIELRTGYEVASSRPTETGVAVEIAGRPPIEGQALVGADGIWSALRRRMFPDRELAFSGKIAARCIIPMSLAKGRFAEPETGVWLGHDAHVVHYPVRGGDAVAVVAIIDEAAERPRRWGTDVPSDGVLARLSGFTAELRAFLDQGEAWQAWSLYDPAPLPAWSSGAVLLIGDAAHPILPFLAQGGVAALEDAAMLAARLHAADGTWNVAVAAFERGRRDRIARIQNAARTNGRIYHMRGMSEFARNTALRLAPPATVINGLHWLYGWTGDPGMPL